MSLSDPFDLLADFPGVSTRFQLMPMVEMTPLRSGGPVSLDLGPAIWEADYRSKNLRPSQRRHWKALLHALIGKTFYGYDTTACWPIAYPGGAWPTGETFDGTATLDTDTTTSLVLGLSGLPEGYTGSVGDYFSITYADDSLGLHQAAEAFTVGSDGKAAFAVVPEIQVGWETATEVDLKKPPVLMMIVPDSIDASGDLQARGPVVFTARQV